MYWNFLRENGILHWNLFLAGNVKNTNESVTMVSIDNTSESTFVIKHYIARPVKFKRQNRGCVPNSLFRFSS